MLRVEDTETAGSDWEEILHNERINRTYGTKHLNIHKTNRVSYILLTKKFFSYVGKMLSAYLSDILAIMVSRNVAAYEPPKQTRAVLVYWRLPEEWAEVLYDWVCNILQNPDRLSNKRSYH